LQPTSTYISADEINRRIKAILGLLDRDISPYNGGDLPSDDAAREIDAIVETYRAISDTMFLALMRENLKAIAIAIELIRLKLVNLKNKYSDDAKKQDVIEEIEMGLEWVARNLKKLRETK
jgi:hypothetical protein